MYAVVVESMRATTVGVHRNQTRITDGAMDRVQTVVRTRLASLYCTIQKDAIYLVVRHRALCRMSPCFLHVRLDVHTVLYCTSAIATDSVCAVSRRTDRSCYLSWWCRTCPRSECCLYACVAYCLNIVLIFQAGSSVVRIYPTSNRSAPFSSHRSRSRFMSCELHTVWQLHTIADR